MARPISTFKLTPAKIAQVADCLFDGLTDSETALLSDLSEKTVARLRRGELCPAIKKGEASRLQHYICKLRDSRGPEWVRIAWFLERRWPERFAKPEVQLGVNLVTNNVTAITITAPQAEKIAKRIREVDAKVEAFLEKKKARLEAGPSNVRELETEKL